MPNTAMGESAAGPSTTQSTSRNLHGTRGSRNRRTPRADPRQGNEIISSQEQDFARHTHGGARQFGGRLTRLHGDTPDFVPGVPAPAVATDTSETRPTLPSRTKKQHRKPKLNKVPQRQSYPADQKYVPRGRRASLLRSKANDIATRTHEDIANGIYECAICTNEISRNSKVWSCRTCWTVFHIGCIKKWSKNEGSAAAQQTSEGQTSSGKQWRCPGCNLPTDSLPTAYSCWCEKEIDPKSIPGVPPHSCGQSCGRSREFPKACPHPCELTCHAGPCPPCTHMGPEQSCFCGKDSTRRRCLETDYESGWSCGSLCGDLLPCGEHTCPRPCHEGLCGDCEVEVDARCYCGKVEQTMLCNSREAARESRDWIGVFNCHQICENFLDCGVHQCEKECHPQDSAISHCPLSPDVISHCPCGKTDLRELTEAPRSACTDGIPNCDKACGRSLACGHPCPQICHSGDCLLCLLTVNISCRCGRNTFNTICHQGQEELPQCMRTCKATLNCGRHECGERCCTGERKATERQSTKRKMRQLGVTREMLEDSIEAEHICTRTCGRSLKCGNHVCQELCHKGPCNSCKEAIFEDISCNCGRTTLQAPLPCGSQPPLCNFPCTLGKACGHPQVLHNCHFETEACPPCPFLVEKQCMCGKKVLKNQPCFRADVPCGLVCGKRLKCGSHTCQNLCHRPGECEDALSPCQQQCGKPKKLCGHPCDKPCHAPSTCKEDKACPFKIIITCDCQRRKEEVRCNAHSGSPTIVSRTSPIKCDDECARLVRNAQLAQALNIPDGHSDDHVPYASTTLSLYSDLETAWTHAQETTLRIFAADETEKRLRFKPMKTGQRAFIHSLAEDFGIDSESVDPEPHRHVVLFKTPKFVSAPMKTLAQAARIRRTQAVTRASAMAENEGTATKRADEAHPPLNGYLLIKPRFALTIDEVTSHIQQVVSLPFHVHFMTQRDAIALIPLPSSSERQLQQQLLKLRPSVAAEISKYQIAESVLLCALDPSAAANPRSDTSDPPILYEQDPDLAELVTIGLSSAAGGWSQVAAKSSASSRRPVPQQKSVGERPVYTVLGSKLAAHKKRKEEEERIARENEQFEKKIAEQGVGENWEDEIVDDEDEEEKVD